MKKILPILIILILGVFIGWFHAHVKSQTFPIASENISSKQVDFKMTMRKLWEDHITWTRMYIISAAFGNKDTNNVASRLLKNQEDIGNAIKPYYGDDAGNKLTSLLKTHITTAVDLLAAAKAGNSDALNSANKKWYDNATDIANFLSSANPNWNKDEMKNMMFDHLNLTKKEGVDILSSKYNDGITDYDQIHNQILKMADTLSDGIINQFPDKF